MSEWKSITEAKTLPGLRLILLRHRPSPWSQAARGIFHIAKVPYTKVHRTTEDGPTALGDWTNQNGFPAAMYEDERPRSGWADILFLAERLSAQPALIPPDPVERAQMFGLAHELMGEMGLIWSFRLFALEARLQIDSEDPAVAEFARKYHSGPGNHSALGKQRMLEVLNLLNAHLEAQTSHDKPYLIGDALSAADVYWATACNVLAPLDESQMVLGDARGLFTATDSEIVKALSPTLLAHRDRIYQDHLELPVVL